MKTSALAIAIIIFSFLGVADAWYLTQSAYSGAPLTCDIAGLDGCNTVAQSPYSHLFGYPLALYGVFFFGFMFVLAAWTLFRPRQVLYVALYMLSIVGVLASLVFIGIQLGLIKAICVYCFGSALLSLLIYLSARSIWKRAHAMYMSTPTSSVLP